MNTDKHHERNADQNDNGKHQTSEAYPTNGNPKVVYDQNSNYPKI